MPDPTPDEAAALLRVAEQQLDQWKAECRALEARLAAQQPVIEAAAQLLDAVTSAPVFTHKEIAEHERHTFEVVNALRAALSGSVEADTPAEPDAAEVAALLRACAAGRREYAENAAPHAVETLAQEAATFDTAAALVEGNYAPLYGLLPSWRWTDAMEARVRGWRGTATTWADVASIAGAAPEREVAGTPAAEPAPDGWCCGAMLRATSLDCDRHSSAHECPDVLVLRDVREGGDYGLPVRDGGSSFVVIGYCPWCGADLLAGAGAPTEPADARPGTCPTCDSSQPHLHPSPDLCTNPWHQPVPTTVAGWRREVSRWAYLLRNLAELADLVADAGPSAGRIADDMTRALAEPADDTQETT